MTWKYVWPFLNVLYYENEEGIRVIARQSKKTSWRNPLVLLQLIESKMHKPALSIHRIKRISTLWSFPQ